MDHQRIRQWILSSMKNIWQNLPKNRAGVVFKFIKISKNFQKLLVNKLWCIKSEERIEGREEQQGGSQEKKITKW